jgi:alkylation response protein AidB-like acyl-CoA dehydrogenase
MTSAAFTSTVQPLTSDIVERARSLGPHFAMRAAAADETDSFVADNFAELKAAGLVAAGVPAEFGGLDADVPELCGMLREIAHHCSSTALAFAMHTHQVAVPAWRWRHQKAAPVVPLLKRVAQEHLLILSSGGSDWVAGSGKAEAVAGGYKITARKIFASASPVGDLLMTGAVLEDEEGGAQVLHFGIPLASPQVTVLDTWRTLGMRATASNDIAIDGHVVPEAAVAMRRPQGEWHPMFQLVGMVALPIIYSVYLGVAEAARDKALQLAGKRRPSPQTVDLVGRMDTELAGARFAHAGMLAAYAKGEPSAETTNEIVMGRTLVARHCLATVDLAMESAGGAAFYRDNGLERLFRDIQAARYHPMQQGQQATFTGRMALGLDVSKTF